MTFGFSVGQGAAGEEMTDRDYAASAEKLGQKLKSALNGGKSQALKLLKVRARASNNSFVSTPSRFVFSTPPRTPR